MKKRLLTLVLLLSFVVLSLASCMGYVDTSKPWYDDHGTLHSLKVCEDQDVIASDTPIFTGYYNYGTVKNPIYVAHYIHIYTYKKELVCSYK